MDNTDSQREKGESQALRSQSILVPSHLTRKEFGKVYVQNLGQQVRVEFTAWVPKDEEGWQTGLALDASGTMKGWYGRRMTNAIPESAMAEYSRKGWVATRVTDGQEVPFLTGKGIEDAKSRGYIRPMENIVQPTARELMSYLASEMDVDNRTTLVYWACGDGGGFEVVGDFSKEECRALEIAGPKKEQFGNGTRLTPVVKYFVDRFSSAKRGIYIFVTDGKLDDLEQVKAYTTELAHEIEAGRRTPVKCVLIGVGLLIDEDQMEQLDDLDTGTDVDIWDHKIHKDMRGVEEVVVELIDESRIVAPSAIIYDAAENVVARFTDGMPAKVSFTMDVASPFFVLEVGGTRIKQTVEVSK
ncbi:MAG: VWA domain-containing protein [Planctomycetota bacterium]|nr:VWA domain-containing protein [Planctomycetota bacterium]